jgi:predicted Zn-dependent protease with MMP-like domain
MGKITEPQSQKKPLQHFLNDFKKVCTNFLKKLYNPFTQASAQTCSISAPPDYQGFYRGTECCGLHTAGAGSTPRTAACFQQPIAASAAARA